jgi:Holliday junction resolvasome RuvABC endonuclease subunit
MLIVGIDPGAKGSVCILDSASLQAEFLDLTTPLDELYDRLSQMPIDAVWIEDVHSLYGMSAKSNFSFGKALGAVETLATIACGGFQKVAPKVWQKHINVTAKGKAIKQEVSSICTQLYPSANVFGKRGGLHDGRSDALMIAHYGMNHHETNN